MHLHVFLSVNGINQIILFNSFDYYNNLKKLATLKDNEMDYEKKRIIIVGAGLVGTLEALFCVQRNYKVDVYEYRTIQDSKSMLLGVV